MTKKKVWWRGAKGEWYVVVQFILFGIIAFGPRISSLDVLWDGLEPILFYPSLIIISFASIIVVLGLIHLGGNLSVFPHPLESAKFVDKGIYGLIRHPIYSGIILLVTGYGLLTGNTLMLIYGILVFIFFEFKTKREEKYLCRKFPEYRDYQKRVKKLLPFIY